MEAYFKCPQCGKEQVGILLTPIEERSLRTLQQAMQTLAEGQESPQCCQAETELLGIIYRFDEPNIEPLQYDQDRKTVTYLGEEIESEEKLQAEAGRPYSIADLHRITLQEQGPEPYSPSPGVVTLKIDRGDPEHLYRQLDQAQAIMEEQDAGRDGAIGPINWKELPGHRTWIGGQAEGIASGEITVVSIIDTESLIGAIEESAERQGLKISQPEKILQIGKGDITLSYDVRQAIELTVEKPLSLHEAAHWVSFAHARSIDCMQEAISILKQKGAEVEIKDGGMIDIRTAGKASANAEINLQSIARKSEYNPEATAEQIDRMLSTMQERGKDYSQLGLKKPCGCTPLLTLVLRPQEWIRELRESSQGSIDTVARPAFGEIDKVLVEDCPHSLAYIYKVQLEEIGASEDELFEQAERNLPKTMFDLQSREFHSVDGEVHAVAWLGHNASTVMLKEEMVRGLDTQSPRVRKGPKELQAICASRDMVLLFDPEADQETIALQLAGLNQELKDSPYDLDPMVHTISFDREGERAGKFTVGELPDRTMF